jgi:hypothetical protein
MQLPSSHQPCCLLEPDACCLPQASKTQLPADQDSGFLWLGPFVKEAPREGGELDERDVRMVPMVKRAGTERGKLTLIRAFIPFRITRGAMRSRDEGLSRARRLRVKHRSLR